MIGADDILVIRRAGYQIAQATPAAFSSILVLLSVRLLPSQKVNHIIRIDDLEILREVVLLEECLTSERKTSKEPTRESTGQSTPVAN